ncbi:MAG TPA: PDZ domain-containing protein [Burkholderiales bacterium]|nr:PDZ domain-containing protein [Burkholderiales bacterium]
MKVFFWVAVAGASLTGCVTAQYGSLVNSRNEFAHCYRTSAGITGGIIASVSFKNCVEGYEKAGYMELQQAGATGIYKVAADGGAVRAASITRGSPAARVGIAEGDVIVSVDGVPVSGSDDAMGRLFGKVDTPVSIVVRGPSGERTVPVTRASYSGLYGSGTFKPD